MPVRGGGRRATAGRHPGALRPAQHPGLDMLLHPDPARTPTIFDIRRLERPHDPDRGRGWVGHDGTRA